MIGTLNTPTHLPISYRRQHLGRLARLCMWSDPFEQKNNFAKRWFEVPAQAPLPPRLPARSYLALLPARSSHVRSTRRRAFQVPAAASVSDLEEPSSLPNSTSINSPKKLQRSNNICTCFPTRPQALDPLTIIGAPEWIRTTDLRFRKPALYPTELRGRLDLSDGQNQRRNGAL